MGRASKDKRDIYYRKAKEEGYRARSAYKLLQIHEEFNILDSAEIRTGAVDLCAAPGSWSQVLANHFKTLTANAAATSAAAAPAAEASSSSSSSSLPPPRVVAVDLQEMAPIEGVNILQGDITSEATANEIICLLNAPEAETAQGGGASPAAAASTSSTAASPRKADIVICDGAPDVTGMHELDEYLQHHLLLAALHITTFILRPGGCFVTKMFRGPNTPFLVAKSEVFFAQVRVVKPKSSRNASMESFLLCQGFRLPAGYIPRFPGDAATPALQHRNEEEAEAKTTTTTTEATALRASGFTPDAPACRYAVSARSDCALQPDTVLAPFLSCGDLSGFDADMCYDRAAGRAVLQPVQPPLQAPYLSAAAGADGEGCTVAKKKVRVEPAS